MMAVDLPQGLGYAGTTIGGAEHAAYLSMVGRGGAGYCGTIDSGKVSIVPSETRTIEVGAGPVYGNAIRDEIPTGVRIQLPEEMAGSRYYLITRRAIWGTTDASRIDYIPGDDTRQIPTYLADPGVEADTPLALVRITAGSSVPTDIVDLRLVATEPGTYTIFDTMALTLAMRPGVVCYHATTGVTYRCVYQNGALAWLQSGGVRPYQLAARSAPYPQATAPSVFHLALADAFGTEGAASATFRAVPGSGDSPANAAYIEVLRDGLYSLGARVAIKATGTFAGRAEFAGTWGRTTAVDWRANTAGTTGFFLSDVAYMRAGDRVQVRMETYNSGTLQSWHLWMTRIGD